MNIFKKLFTAAYALIASSCSSPANVPDPGMPEEVTSQVTWINESEYQYLDDRESDTRRALKVAKKNGHYHDYYARYRLGNLCIIEASSNPSAHVMDATGKSGYVGVLLAKTPQYVELPNRELFAQFMKFIRTDPEQLKPSIRFKTISILTGTRLPLFKNEMANDNIVKASKIEPQDPTWKDEAGVLEITYYTYQPNGMMAPLLVYCTLTIDQEQKYTISCEQVQRDEESEQNDIAGNSE